jgi:hypothetical protein
MFGRYSAQIVLDYALRSVLAALAFIALLHPNEGWATSAAVIAAAGVLAGIWRHRQVARPEEERAAMDDEGPGGDLKELSPAKINLAGEG